jgi:hypothetical protein
MSTYFLRGIAVLIKTARSSVIALCGLGLPIFVPVKSIADMLPSPGMTLRSNSVSCLSKFQDLHQLVSDYVNGIPPYSSLKRLDLLTGGIVRDTPSEPLPVGTELDTQMYATVSSYATVPENVFRGSMKLAEDGYLIQHIVQSRFDVQLPSGAIARFSWDHLDCGISSKAKTLSLSIQKRWTAIDSTLQQVVE